jgi:hypothetical protein
LDSPPAERIRQAAIHGAKALAAVDNVDDQQPIVEQGGNPEVSAHFVAVLDGVRNRLAHGDLDVAQVVSRKSAGPHEADKVFAGEPRRLQ